MWPCDVDDCNRRAVRILGECILCDRHLCSRHITPEFHPCPKWEDAELYDPVAREATRREISRLLNKIDRAALASRASSLRNGRSCTIFGSEYGVKDQKPAMGGMNYHFEIRFDDGITWLARVRRTNGTSPPPQLRDAIVRSEVASLQFLETVDISTPRIFDYALEGPDNPVGVGYVFMEKMQGEPMNWYDASPEQRLRVQAQLAGYMQELSRHPFDQIGSLDVPGTVHMGGLAREDWADVVDLEIRYIGPFADSKDYLTAKVRLVLDLILREEMYATRSIDAYLIHLALLGMIPAVMRLVDRHDDEKFYMKHADDKGDHILVDDDFNITAIIDWEWAYTAPKALAFIAPLAFFHVGEFYDGVNTLGPYETDYAQQFDDQGRGDLAAIVRDGKLLHRFAFCCGADLEDWDGFMGLFKGLLALTGDGPPLPWDGWRAAALVKYAEDEGLKDLLSR